MPRALAALLAVITGVVVLSGGAQASSPLQRGTVVAIVNPSSLSVRLSDGTVEAVQLFGLAPPGAGSCDFAGAVADTTSLALRKLVWLVVIPGSHGPKRSGTAVAYAILAGGRDLGLELLQRGDATVSAKHHPFKKLSSYLRAQDTAQSTPLGLWACASAATPTKSSSTPPGEQSPPSTPAGPPSIPPGQQKKLSTSSAPSDNQGQGNGGGGSQGHGH